MKPDSLPDVDTFGRLLRRARIAADLGQQELADTVGVDISYISKLENDRLRPPAAKTVEQLAATLGVPPAELLAAAGKLPTGMDESLATPNAIRFLGEAQEMQLTGQEWQQMVHALRGLRSQPQSRKQGPN
jgi:transcriptional regulator with XRE-family HTH domain